MPRKRPEEKPADHPALDAVVLLLVSGMPLAELEEACRRDLAIPDARVLIDAARRRVTIAAKYHPDEQLGTAITRLNDLYARALKTGDVRTALSAQKEIGKLLNLEAAAAGQEKPAGDGDASQESAELAAIAAHLLPLKLAPQTHPLREHARVAAERIHDIDP